MEVLGYPLTWITTCFIDGGCGQPDLFGHTNGHGDFVVLDRLGAPWLIHDCYARRFELSPRAALLKIGATRDVSARISITSRPWEEVRPITPSFEEYWKEVEVFGTVVDLFASLGEWRREFRNVYGPRSHLLHDQVHRNRSVVRLVTGDGEEYHALYNPNEHKLRFRDLVGATLKVKPLFDEFVFFVITCKRFRG